MIRALTRSEGLHLGNAVSQTRPAGKPNPQRKLRFSDVPPRLSGSFRSASGRSFLGF